MSTLPLQLGRYIIRGSCGVIVKLGKERKGKERKGKERKGKERKATRRESCNDLR